MTRKALDRARSNTASLNILQLQKLDQALQQIDGYSYMIRAGQPVYCLFALGAVRLPLAKLSNRLRTHLDQFEKARVALVAECKVVAGAADIAELKPGHPNFQRFQAEYDKMAEAKVDVEIEPIAEADLHLEQNEIPITALAALAAAGVIV